MEMQTVILIILAIAGTTGLIIYFINTQIKQLNENIKGGEKDQILMEWLRDMKTSMEKGTDTVNTQLHNQRTSMEEQLTQQREVMTKQTKLIWERLTEAQTVIGNVQKQIGAR